MSTPAIASSVLRWHWRSGSVKRRNYWALLDSIPWSLVAILAVQAIMSLRLLWTNTAFLDEATYLFAGHVEIAHWLHGSSRLSALRVRAGRPAALPSPEEAAARPYTAAEQAVIAEATGSHVVGGPAAVGGLLNRLVASTGADELMVTTSTFAHADRLASYELLAQAAAGASSRRQPL